MVKLEFSIDINAPAEKVYRTMLGLDDKSTYNHWTSIFNPTSTFEGSWDEGEKIRFVGLDEKGNKAGMFSKIVTHEPAQFLSIKHKGVISDGKELTKGPKAQPWIGAKEEYTFSEKDGVTTVEVTTDTIIQYKKYFKLAWPKALERLKKLIEE